MSLKKKILLWLVPRIYHLLVFFIGISCRKRYYGRENLESLQKENKQWIYSIWHNNIAMCSWLLRGQNIVTMVSNSMDGELISRGLHAMKHETVRGSSSKGGGKALVQIIKAIKKGKIGTITPDGPRGPKYVLQSGIMLLAQKTGLPLIPYHFESDRQWVFLKSWDHHKIPKPFSTIVTHFGEPFYVTSTADKEQLEVLREEFQQKMLRNVANTINKLKEK